MIVKGWLNCIFDLLVSWNSTQELSHPLIFLFVYISVDSWFLFYLQAYDLCVCVCVLTRSVIQLCHTLCDSMDCSPPSPLSSGVFHARILMVAISRQGIFQLRGWTCVSCMAGRFWYLPLSKLWEALWFVYYYYHYLFWCSNCPRLG